MPRIATLEQFRRRAPRLQALLGMLRAEADALRADIAALRAMERIATAAGVHLDRWGELVGALRAGLGDADYRRVLLATLLAFRARGVAVRIVEAAELLTDVPVTYLRRGVAAYRLTVDTSAGDALGAAFLARVGDVLQTMAPAGVEATAVECRGLRFDSGHFDTEPMGRRI